MPAVWSKRPDAPEPPKGAVYVGRPSKWGNPFDMGPDRTRAMAIHEYREWFFAPEQEALREEARRELAGKDLVCWCAPRPCHADVLLVWANDQAMF